ncbi:MAG: tetratricopeptide repeat protein [Adhaeribacter sp.]
MKVLVAVFLFLSMLGEGLQLASRINKGVQEAEAMYKRGQYRQAVALYQYLHDSLQVSDEQLVLNQAHAAFQAGDNKTATRNYTLLSRNPDPTLQSVASTQLALLYYQKGNTERALYTFKKALIQDPGNETARFNYELLKKYLDANPSMAGTARRPPQKPTPPPGPREQGASQRASVKAADTGSAGSTSDQQREGSKPPISRPEPAAAGSRGGSPSGQGQPGAGETGKPRQTPQGSKGNQQQGLSNEDGGTNGPGDRNREGTEALGQQEKQMQTLRARLKNSDLSPEKATQLLEAMRHAELQYLQQLPHKAQKPRSTSRPDW